MRGETAWRKRTSGGAVCVVDDGRHHVVESDVRFAEVDGLVHRDVVSSGQLGQSLGRLDPVDAVAHHRLRACPFIHTTPVVVAFQNKRTFYLKKNPAVYTT